MQESTSIAADDPGTSVDRRSSVGERRPIETMNTKGKFCE
jgi:hypothetical protein